MPVAGGHLDAGVSEPMIEVATSWVLARDLPARLFTGFSPFFCGYMGTSSRVAVCPPRAS
jgi:hypothetical protein